MRWSLSQVTLEYPIKIGLSKLRPMSKAPPQHPDIGQRITEAMKAQGLKLKDVAKEFGKTAQAVHNWKMGINLPKHPQFVQLAELLKVNVVWLTTGKGPREPDALSDAVVIVKPRGRLVPRLTVEDVENKRFQRFPEDAETVLTHFPCGVRSFEFPINDQSNAPEFLIGDAVIIDPDLRPAPGDMVLALVDSKSVFRKFVEKSGSEVELRPLNADWGTATVDLASGAELIGTMSEHAKPRRRN